MAEQKQERLLSLRSYLITAILAIIGYALNRLPEDLYVSIGAKITYKWLLIAITIIILICLYSFVNYFILYHKYSKETPSKTKQRNSNDAEPISNPMASLFEEIPPIKDKSLFSEKPTQREIIAQIADQPAYLQDQTAKSFIGFRIHWILLLQYILPPENYHVIDVGFFDNIRGAIDTKEFPDIKIAKVNDPFEIWAEIADIHYPIIELGIHYLKRQHDQTQAQTK